MTSKLVGKLVGTLFAAGILLAAPALAGAPDWRGADAETGQLTAVGDLTQLARDYPDSSTVRLRLLNALADAGNTDAAGMAAIELARRGYAFSPQSEGTIAGWLDIDYAQWFASAMQVNRHQIAPSSLLTTVPAEAQLVEGLARDPKSGDLYATTIVSRALFVKRGEADWQRLELAGAGSLAGVAWDAKKKLLWVASGDYDQTPGEKVSAALIGFDPAAGQVARRLEAGGMVPLGDVAVGDDGTVYAADPVHGVIYAAGPTDQALRQLAAPGSFRSPQGLVPAPGNRLIVSDYRYGLAVYDMGSGRVTRLSAAKPAMLDGIDGLWRRGHSLIAVQNGTSPKRILRLELADDWLSIKSVTVLESDAPGWTEPLGGTLDGDRLLYVGTGRWDRFGDGGALADGADPGTTDIRALPLGK
ncbi:MAG: hypothetical protein J7496_15010 [Novosphingobium sp.]|nr:hypothetical protein [Novosphingobium sp.]MBO9603810.1 hypothetical protein [Novosphingobium sp.]